MRYQVPRTKTPGSSRKKGDPNKVNVLRKQAAGIKDLAERHAFMMNKAYELATNTNSNFAPNFSKWFTTIKVILT